MSVHILLKLTKFYYITKCVGVAFALNFMKQKNRISTFLNADYYSIFHRIHTKINCSTFLFCFTCLHLYYRFLFFLSFFLEPYFFLILYFIVFAFYFSVVFRWWYIYIYIYMFIVLWCEVLMRIFIKEKDCVKPTMERQAEKNTYTMLNCN